MSRSPPQAGGRATKAPKPTKSAAERRAEADAIRSKLADLGLGRLLEDFVANAQSHDTRIKLPGLQRV